MATVLGVPATRGQEIINSAVVSGHIDGSGHLILKTYDDTEFDAGLVSDNSHFAPAIATEVSNRNSAISAAMSAMQTEINDSDIAATTLTTNFATNLFFASTGWTLNTVVFEKVGRLAYLSILITRDVAAGAISNSGTSNIANVQCVLGFHPDLRPPYTVPMHGPSGGNGRIVGCSAHSDGTITLDAIGGSSDFGAGEDMSFAGLWLCASETVGP